MSRLVVGFGNAFRRDDGAGHAVVERLGDDDAIAARDGAVEMVERMSGYDRVVLVDAVRSGAAPGTIHRFEDGRCFPRAWGGSSHSIGLVEVLELAKALHTLPAAATVVGIEADDTGEGVGLSQAVDAAVDTLVAELADA